MKLLVNKAVAKRWTEALDRAGVREIGGVLLGEHVGEETFRIADITVQMSGGRADRFKRAPRRARKAIDKFLRTNDSEHERFNYLGEWHSHPNAPALPSPVDQDTMRDIIGDPETDANFLVLVIVRLVEANALEMSAQAFLASGHQIICDIQLDGKDCTNQ